MGPVNRPLDLQWLEDLLALAETGNFSRAAQSRSMAQPAFSRHIRALEEWAGLELVDRARHPASATPAGEVLLLAARDVVLKLTQARTQAHQAYEQASRSLQFAATHVLSLAFFPAWLQKIEQQLQLGPIHMTSDSFEACEDLMLQRRVQFLLCYGHPAVRTRLLEPAFKYVCVSTDWLLPVAAPDAAGGARHAISPKVSQPLPLLAYSAQSALGQIMQSEMKDVGDSARYTPVITSHHAVLLKTMALEGRGIAWLPQSLVSAEMADGRLVAAGAEAASVPVEIRLFRATALLPQAAEAVWSQVKAFET
ncbi:MAG: transcriptional regulator, LysR family [Polaromonas sp.]|nr:transcriptional regulator, LysR family [Polaromonas sp.]